MSVCKMKFFCFYAIATATLITGMNFGNLALMVSDVQDYYKAASVFIVNVNDDHESESLHKKTFQHHLQREFSRKFVRSLTLDYYDMLRYENYRNYMVEPLFVVLLNNAEEVDRFHQLTGMIDMSYALWFVIFTSPTIIEVCHQPIGNYFNLAFDSEVLVNCYGNKVIREWYSLHENTTEIYDFASWDDEHGLQLVSNMSLYDRRNNLDGKSFPIVFVKDGLPGWKLENNIPVGFFSTILTELSESLNFTLDVRYIEDVYGMYNENTGAWTGALGRMEAGEAEIGLAEFTMTANRLDAAEFTFPIMMTRVSFYVMQPDGSALNLQAYFKIYTFNFWILIQLMFLVTWTSITVLRCISEGKSLPSGHLSENCIQVLSIMTMQGMPGDQKFPKRSSIRIAYFFVLLEALVVYIIYSACLISYLTLNNPSLPFNDLEGLIKDKSYKLIVMRDSAHHDYFQTSSDALIKKIKTLMPDPEDMPRTMTGGFKRICIDKCVFYTSGTIRTRVNYQIPCDVISYNVGRIDSLSFVVKKRSNYKGLINHHLLKFQSTGILSRLRAQMYRKVRPVENKYNPVNFESIAIILLVLAVGVVLSLLILSCEIFVRKAIVLM